MSEPDTEHATGPVTPQPPLISNYWLVLTVLHSVSVWLSHRDNSSHWCNHRLSAER
jgi:hypothetical protein